MLCCVGSWVQLHPLTHAQFIGKAIVQRLSSKRVRQIEIRQRETMRGHHFWYIRYRVPPLQSGGITECLRTFPFVFERLSIPVVR